MGSTASREAPVPDTPHPGRFDARELQYLTESFRDLAGRHSKKDSIDAGTFRRAFDLPGLVGERLFAVAQGDHEGVEFSNFVGILAVGLRGDAFEARALLFAMFDLDGDNKVDENELRAMLNHFPPQGDGLTNEELVKGAQAPLDEAQFGRWLRSQPAVADFVLKALVPPVRSRRLVVSRRLHAIGATRVHQTRSWVVSFSSLRSFGPNRDAPRRSLP